MNSSANPSGTAFVWNAGGWFGAQLGSTLWMAILGFVLLAKDLPAAATALAGFALANAAGFFLWRGRARRSAYSGLQLFLLALALIVAAVVAVVQLRGASETPTSGVSTYLPWWVAGLAPILMLVFLLRERAARRQG
jgi:NADH:ubiquinone oxidoreductase subunit 6 (subunit J)